MNRMHAMKADVYRVYLPYQGGGTGLINLEKEYKAAMAGNEKYMTQKDDIQIQASLKYEYARVYFPFCFVILDVRTKVLKVLNNRKKMSLGDKLSLPTGQLLQV